MLIDRDENIVIITQEQAYVKTLVNNIEQVYDKYRDSHIIINLLSLDTIELDDVIEFLSLSNKHRGAKKSFVIITDKVDIDTMPDEICVVPTTQEAYDIIEMEDIERDLGF